MNKIVKIFVLICIFTVLAVIAAKNTYGKLETKTKISYYVKTNDYIVDPALGNNVLEFPAALNKIARKFKNEINAQNNKDCPLDIVGDSKAIQIFHDTGIDNYMIILVGLDENNIEVCYQSIIRETTNEFYERIKSLILQLERGALITQQIIRKDRYKAAESIYLSEQQRIDEGRYEQLNLSDEKKINFSELLKLIETRQIKDMGIGIDFVLGSTINGDRFYTVSKGFIDSPIVLKKLSDYETNFYLINEDNNKISASKTFDTTSRLRLQVKRALYEDLLTQVPYIFLKKQKRAFKISYKNYLFLMVLFVNILGLMLFFFINKETRTLFVNFYKRLS
jgi:hypothetical protein